MDQKYALTVHEMNTVWISFSYISIFCRYSEDNRDGFLCNFRLLNSEKRLVDCDWQATLDIKVICGTEELVLVTNKLFYSAPFLCQLHTLTLNFPSHHLLNHSWILYVCRVTVSHLSHYEKLIAIFFPCGGILAPVLCVLCHVQA